MAKLIATLATLGAFTIAQAEDSTVSPSPSPTATSTASPSGVTPPFVKNCTLRPEFTRGIGVISGSTGLTLDKSSIRSRLPRRPRYRSSGAVVTSASRLNVQFFTNGGVTQGVTPNSTLELSIHNLPSESDLRGQTMQALSSRLGSQILLCLVPLKWFMKRCHAAFVPDRTARPSRHPRQRFAFSDSRCPA